MEAVPEVSFCATNLNTRDRLPLSLDSVFALGDSLRRPFEVIVADGPSTDGARALLEERAARDPRLHIVAHDRRNRGYGRRRAFEASRGGTIVPFDTSLAYAPLYGELLGRYLTLETEAMLFSEICALRRSTILAVGGWRDLVGGEDIDLYARVIEKFGIIAYPTAARESQARALGSYARQMRYVSGSRLARTRRILAVVRDQIIGDNYTVGDLMAFNARKPLGRRIGYRFFFSLAALQARFSPLRPYRFERNNYLILREETLRSLLEGREAGLGWAGPPPRLLLTDDEITYLEARSRLWKEAGPRVRGFVARKA
jgi:glycosyltransferase involved in cell wall biosynthesis